MEIFGRISDGIKNKYNPIYFKKSLFKKLKTNNDILITLSEWAKDFNIQIT